MIVSALHRIAADATAATESDSMARASELMDLIKSPTAVATGVLIVFARAELKKNADTELLKKNSRNALVASILALIITVAVAVVMSPLLWRVVVQNTGEVETRLLVYVMTFIVAVCTAVYVANVAIDSLKDWTAAQK